MTAPTNNEWIHDWNQASTPLIPPGTRVLLNDETLRDGLQNPSVYDPTIEEKIEILHLMESLGIDSVNIGLPGAGPRAVAHTEALAREIAAKRMKIRKPIFAPSLRFHNALESPSKPPPSSAPVPSAAWSKTGPSSISSAPRKRP
jgi:hypothetical protein